MVDELLPLIVHDVFATDALVSQREWQPLAEGVTISVIYETDSGGSRAAFLRYDPGAAVPSHIHQGFEHILILSGYQLDGENRYTKGALVIHPAGSRHQVRAPEGCVALGIWEKPVVFTADS